MAKFVYRMQNILNLNQKLEDQAKIEYATQQAVLNEAEERKRGLGNAEPDIWTRPAG